LAEHPNRSRPYAGPATDQVSRLFEPEAVQSINALAELLVGRDDDEHALEAKLLLGRLHWYRYLALPQGQDAEDLEAAHRRSLIVPMPTTPDLPEPAPLAHARDEADLAAAFQLAGFPHVIATLWEVPDTTAVTVADTFYTHLHTHPDDPTPDTNRAAHALHHAIRALRDQYPNLPSLWAAYLHAGA